MAPSRNLAAQTDAQSQHPLHSLAKQCHEDAIEMHLDPGPFRDFVGSEFSLALEEGKARVVIVVQDCSQYGMDGEGYRFFAGTIETSTYFVFRPCLRA